MARYAQGTTVSIQSSMAEVQRLMARFGVKPADFMQVSRGDYYACWWKLNGFMFSAKVEGDRLDEREKRRRWRVIVNHIKSQLISVEEGLVSKEEALLTFMMLPGDIRATDILRKQLAESKAVAPVFDLPALP